MASSGAEKRSPANLVRGLGSLEVIAPFETHTHTETPNQKVLVQINLGC